MHVAMGEEALTRQEETGDDYARNGRPLAILVTRTATAPSNVSFKDWFRTGATGQLPPLDDSGKQSSERLLNSETCRKTNSHNSAIAAGGVASAE